MGIPSNIFHINNNFQHQMWPYRLLFNDDDQLLVQNMNEDEKAGKTAELLKDLFPDFSYVKRKRKPKRK